MEKELLWIRDKLISKYNPKAIGIFGSSSKNVSKGRDIDVYALITYFNREVLENEDYIYEVYFGEPKSLEKAIEMKNIEIIDRFRNSRIIYDPNQIYKRMVEKSKNQDLRKEIWREETILGGRYDLIERTKEHVCRSIEKGELESAISSLQALVSRILDIGFRRMNLSGYANPKNTPHLVKKYLPKKMNTFYRKVMFSDLRDKNKITQVIRDIEKNKLELLPKI